LLFNVSELGGVQKKGGRRREDHRSRIGDAWNNCRVRGCRLEKRGLGEVRKESSSRLLVKKKRGKGGKLIWMEVLVCRFKNLAVKDG